MEVEEKRNKREAGNRQRLEERDLRRQEEEKKEMTREVKMQGMKEKGKEIR